MFVRVHREPKFVALHFDAPVAKLVPRQATYLHEDIAHCSGPAEECSYKVRTKLSESLESHCIKLCWSVHGTTCLENGSRSDGH